MGATAYHSGSRRSMRLREQLRPRRGKRLLEPRRIAAALGEVGASPALPGKHDQDLLEQLVHRRALALGSGEADVPTAVLDRAEHHDGTDVPGAYRMGTPAGRGVDALDEDHAVAFHRFLAQRQTVALLADEVARHDGQVAPYALVGGGLGTAQRGVIQLGDRDVEIDGARPLAEVERARRRAANPLAR